MDRRGGGSGGGLTANSDHKVNNYLKQGTKVKHLVKHSMPDFGLNTLFVQGLSACTPVEESRTPENMPPFFCFFLNLLIFKVTEL